MTLNGHTPKRAEPPAFAPCERCGERCRVMPGALHNRCVICDEILRRQAKPERVAWVWWTGLVLIGLLIAGGVAAACRILGSMP